MEDLIDFPVSADWLDYYHSRGLTPRNSGRPQRDYLYEEVISLRKEMAEIRLILQLLLEEVRNNRRRRHSSQEAHLPSTSESLLKEGE